MTLQETAETLRRSVKDGALLLDGSLDGLDGLATLLSLLESTGLRLELDGAGVTTEGGAVRAAGRTTFLGAPADAQLVFDEGEDKKVRCALDVRLASLSLQTLSQSALVPKGALDASVVPAVTFGDVTLSARSRSRALSVEVKDSAFDWTLSDELNLSLKNIGFSLTRTLPRANGGGAQKDAQKRVEFSVNGDMQLGSAPLGVAVEFPTAPLGLPDQWGVTLHSGQSFAAGLNDLLGLVGGSGGLDLPPGVSELASFSLERFSATFSPSARSVSSVALTLKSTEMWEMAPSVNVEEVGLSLFVAQPSSSKRTVSAEVFGKIRLGSESRLAVKLVRPAGGGDWLLSLTEPLSLSGLAELANVPGGLDVDALQLPEELSNATLWLNRFDLDFNPSRRSISRIAFGLSSEVQWNVISQLSIGDPSVNLEIVNPFGGAQQRAVKGGMGGVLTVGGASIYVGAQKADLTSGWQLTGRLQPGEAVRLTDIARDVLGGAALPDEVPDLEFSDLALTVTPSTGALAFRGRAKATWDLPFGVEGLAVTTVDLDIQKGPSTGSGAQRVAGPVTCSLKLAGEAAVTIVEGLTFKRVALGYDLAAGGAWKLSGSVAATIFDADYTLSASLEQSAAQRRISLTASTTAATLVSFDGVGSLSARAVSIVVAKQLQPPQSSAAPAPAEGAVSLGASSPYTWEVVVTGGLKVTGVLDLEGALQLFKQADRAGLAFRATNAEARIPLPIPQHSAELRFGLERISVIRSSTASGAQTWAFDAAASVWCTGLPEKIQSLLAQRSTGTLKVDGAGLQLSVNRLLQPLEIEAPDVSAGSITIELGTMALDASNLALAFRNGSVSLSLDFGVGLPAKLNNLFGKKSDGSPASRVFNTYVRDNPASITKFRIGVDTALGVNIQMVTSPFLAVRLVPGGPGAAPVQSPPAGQSAAAGQSMWWEVDLGDFGKIRLMAPVFSYTGDGFVARGGFEQVEPLMIPLAPLKALLSGAGLGAAASALPRGIPLQDLDIYDSATGRFKFDEFIRTIETLGGFPLPQETKDALRAIESRLDLLPERFKSYLDVEIPQSFQFDISVTPDGGARGKVWVTGDKPLKFIYPSLGLVGPVLNGVELYSITFGEVLGGSLMILDVDARFDSYDLLVLVAAMALPLDKLPILPDTRQLTRRLVVKRLFMVIIYQAGIPIPVPLFFDELGVEYLYLEGLELQTHWGFPRPTLSASDAAHIFKDFENFFTQRDHLLDASNPPAGLDLRLVVGPNYIQLPKYLGGKSLGSRDEKTVVSAYSNLAHLLNALKTLSLNELIQALPLEKRVGSEQVSFASMTLVVNWLITTPKEFRDGAFRSLNVPESEMGQTLQVLPPRPGKDDQGLVVFLKGEWSIAGAASLSTTFGLVGASRGFGTGLRVAGAITDILEVEMGGAVVIDTKAADVFSLSGQTRLRVLGDEVLAGDLLITENRLAIRGRLDLFPRSPVIRITGEVAGRISDSEFYLGGSATVTVGGFFTLVSASAEITHTGVRVSGTWLNQTVTFSAQRQGASLELRATLSPVAVGSAFRLTDASGAFGPLAVLGLDTSGAPSVYISARISLLGVTAGGSVSFSERGFELTVEGHIYNLFQATLTARGANLLNGDGFYIKATLRNDLFAYLKDNASRAINDAASSATRQLSDAQAQVDKAQRDVDTLNRQIDDARRTVQQEREGDQQRLRDAQAAVQSAQDQVNSLQRQIDDANAKIKSLKRDIDKKKKWYKDLPWYKQSYGWTELGAYTTAKGAEITAQYTAIGGLETAKATASGALELAKQSLRGFEQASKTFPVDADPRVAGPIVALNAATGALNTAKATLGGIRSGIKLVPVDADPRVSGLIVARETATGALKVANGTLEGLKVSIGAMAQVGDYIVKNGLGALLDVRAATFEASLSVAQGGRVALAADLVFMGSPRSVQFSFDFNDPLRGTQDLARLLMPK
jgi:hypothetical protein